jgi:hypothetical protein
MNSSLERLQPLRDLHQGIVQYFDQSELQTLVFYLGVDWDELRGEIKSEKTLSLIQQLGQNSRLPELTQLLRQQRPYISWPDLPASMPWLTPKRKEPFRQGLIEQVRFVWVRGLLQNSLHGVVWLELGLEYNPDAVERPWAMTLAQPDHLDRPVTPGTGMVDVFHELGGSLLILGEPGSGKTTMLLELTRDLLDIAELDESQPIPLVFNLSSWAQKRQPLLDWLVEEMNITYGVNKKFGRHWLAQNPVRLLLDGLDEVAEEYRSACVAVINQYRQDNTLQAHGQSDIAICSRTEEYKKLNSQLKLMGAVVIQPLTLTQVDKYLAAAGEPLAATRQAIQSDEVLQELALSPLALSIMTLAYRGKSPTELTANTLKARRHHLFTAYVQRMLARRPLRGDYSTEQARQWLAWLAAGMVYGTQTIFYIEQMQPGRLPEYRHRRYTTYSGLAIALVHGLIFGLSVGVGFGQAFGLESGLVTGLIGFGIGLSGVLGVQLDKIELAEAIYWSWQEVRSRIGIGMGVPLLVMLVCGLAVVLIGGLGFGLGLGLVVVLIVVLSGLRTKQLEKQTIPNKAVWSSAGNAVRVGLVFGLLGGLGVGLILGLVTGLVTGLIFGLIFGLWYGGNAFIQHFILRWRLSRENYLPWRLVEFLDDMAEHILLRKVGGGYIFIHRMVMEYFAGLATKQV